MSTQHISVTLTQELISKPSITPRDEGCQALLNSKLAQIGFAVHPIERNGILNTWARRGTKGPLFCFAGHTDVVPTGPREQWTFDPFVPSIHEGYLYGRGAADMKAGLAAFVTAAERFVNAHPLHNGSIAVLLTADEEGPATDGTVAVVDWLKTQGTRIDYCVVGEPTSVNQLGDMIKNGRRGSLSGTLIIEGIQGHVAYPHLADNPVHRFAPALAELAAIEWDKGDEYFPATTFQVSNIKAGTGATNVIPGACEVQFNFRHAAITQAETLKHRFIAVLNKHQLRHQVTWTSQSPSFLTKRGFLTDSLAGVVQSVTNQTCELSCTGGTSDGRFIADICDQVVEIGPVNASIHKVNECVWVDDIVTLHEIYFKLLQKVLL